MRGLRATLKVIHILCPHRYGSGTKVHHSLLLACCLVFGQYLLSMSWATNMLTRTWDDKEWLTREWDEHVSPVTRGWIKTHPWWTPKWLVDGCSSPKKVLGLDPYPHYFGSSLKQSHWFAQEVRSAPRENKIKKADFGIVLNPSRMSCAAGEEMIALSNMSTTADSSLTRESESPRKDFRTEWLYQIVSACNDLISLESVWIDQNLLQMPRRIVW